MSIQRGDVAAVAVTAEHAAITNARLGKFLHGGLLDILCHSHFQGAGITPFVQRQRHENFCLLSASASFFAYSRAAKVRVIEFDNAA